MKSCSAAKADDSNAGITRFDFSQKFFEASSVCQRRSARTESAI
jgi:hypothetical protein